MAAGRREDAARQVKEAADLVDWVGRTVRLRKAGQNYEGLCPFHEEKTPSFKVHPERQTFRCFGCGKAGDIFTFVMETERVGFVQALEMLADRYGITLVRSGGEGARQDRDGRRRILAVLEWAAGAFAAWLRGAEGRAARTYLRQRGFEDRTIQEARLGCSPPAWDALLRLARPKGFSPALLEKAGLVIRRGDDSGWYDRFRGRVLFPVQDPYGRIVSFGGRILPGSERAAEDREGARAAPKYVNGPETEVFHKAEILYGLSEARRAPGRRIAVMEGYTDVLLARQAGVPQAVATLGTALTPQHARLLKRFDVEVVLVYDGDVAGREASARGVEVLLRQDLDVFVARLPEGIDPADWVRRDGPEPLARALREAQGYLEARLGALRGRGDLATIEGRARAAAEVGKLAAVLGNPVKQELLLREAAAAIGVGEAALRRLAGGERMPGRTAAPATAAATSPAGAGARAEAELCQGLLGPIVIEDVDPNPLDVLEASDFEDSVAREVFRLLQGQWWAERGIDPEELVLAEERPEIRERILAWREDIQSRNPLPLLEGGLRFLWGRRVNRRLAEIRVRRRQAEQEGAEERVAALLREEQTLLSERDGLRGGSRIEGGVRAEMKTRDEDSSAEVVVSAARRSRSPRAEEEDPVGGSPSGQTS